MKYWLNTGYLTDLFALLFFSLMEFPPQENHKLHIIFLHQALCSSSLRSRDITGLLSFKN